MVVEADDTSDLPYSIFVLPEVNELRLADRLGILVSGMVKTVNADLHRAIVGNGVYLKRPWTSDDADQFRNKSSRVVVRWQPWIYLRLVA